ncbi:MAG: hypothetical protein SGI77_26055 [Pirellulaceae bacterium]|nr:hypothetical protein [Pirellulaceae bacterium]
MLSTAPVLDLLAGDYYINFKNSDSSSGAYSFRLLNLGTASTLVSGIAISNTLNPATETDVYSFSANAGDHFSFVTSTVAPQNAAWRLLDPLGRDVFNEYLGTNLTDVMLGMTGTYTLLIEGYIYDTGTIDYGITANFLSNTPPIPFTGTALTLGTTVSSTIGVAGEQDFYTFTLGAASRLYFDHLSSAGNITWSLQGPSGVVVANRYLEYELYFAGLDPTLNLIAGIYQLKIAGFGSATGAYSFRMVESRCGAVV